MNTISAQARAIALQAIRSARVEKLVDLADRAAARRLDQAAVARANRIEKAADGEYVDLVNLIQRGTAQDAMEAAHALGLAGNPDGASAVLSEAI